VQRFLSIAEKRGESKPGLRRQALANFDINKLRVIPGTAWAIILEYAGLSTDERQDSKWKTPTSTNEVEPKGVPRQQFQLFCYIRKGPGTDGGDNSRHVEDFVGLPTSKQIEE
jgi:hypothetical protein